MKTKKINKYEKPIFIKERKLTFPRAIIEKVTGQSCLQCSGCHGCR